MLTHFGTTVVDIASYASFLKQGVNKRRTTLPNSIQWWLRQVLLPLIRKYTPVSDKDGAGYVHAYTLWRGEIINSGTGQIVSITNERPYAHFLEYGSRPGSKPWPRSSAGGRIKNGLKKNGRQKTRKGSGRTTLAEDPNINDFHQETGARVWAGGLNPGHSITVGGPIARAMQEAGRYSKDADFGDYSAGGKYYISYSPLITSIINDVFGIISKNHKAPIDGGVAPTLRNG